MNWSDESEKKKGQNPLSSRRLDHAIQASVTESGGVWQARWLWKMSYKLYVVKAHCGPKVIGFCFSGIQAGTSTGLSKGLEVSVRRLR